MPDASLTLRRATEDDLDRVAALLDANDLPSREVRSRPGYFFLAHAGSTCIGIGGIEAKPPAGLLRSVVVAAPYRGQGYGGALCTALEAKAREQGFETLYLLTTTATGFFRERGYAVVDRETAPLNIRETTQFRDRCPATADCLRKRLR